MAADVADEPFFGSVKSEGECAVAAFADVGASWALERAGKSSAVEKEDNLLALGKFTLHVASELVGENRGSSFVFPALDFHIDNADNRHGLTIGALGELKELVFAVFRVVK